MLSMRPESLTDTPPSQAGLAGSNVDDNLRVCDLMGLKYFVR